MTKWKKLEFDKAFLNKTSKAHKIDQSQFLTSGNIPIIDQGHNSIAGYTNDNSMVWKRQLPVIIFGDHTRIVKFIDFPFVLGADGTKVLEINKEIFPLFAYYQLLSHEIPSAGYSRHFKFLKDWIIKFPSLPEQQRIAAILQKADRIRRLRRYAHQLSDGYMQSVFLEMFGDPLGKSRIFPVVKLGDIVRINPSLDYQVNSEMDVSFIPMAAIDEASASITSPEIHKLSEVVKGYTSFQENDVLFAKITPCMENGKSAIARNLHNFVGFGSTEFHVLRPTDQTNSEWLLFLVRDRAFRSAAKNAFTGTAGQQRVPTSFLENYKVKKPQEGDLEIFRNLYEKHFGLTIYLTESERQAEQLFQSLLHQAFEEQDR